jgi:hypothetical protein
VAGNSLPEQIRVQVFLPKYGEDQSFKAANLFTWLLEPYALRQNGQRLYLNKKGTGEHWKQVLCALVVTLESKDFKTTSASRTRFDELMELPLGHLTGDRDSMIRAAFNGTNLGAVTDQFKVSRATVYRAANRRKSHNP